MESKVVNLFVHGPRGTRPDDVAPVPMVPSTHVDAVTGCGLKQDERYFRPADPGRIRPRQVSLIDEATIWRHERVFGPIDRSTVKSQIVLAGEIHLPDLLGVVLTFDGGAELTVSLARRPCYAMDLIAPGLLESMKDGHQGVLARVTAEGPISLGQRVTIQVPSGARLEQVG